MFGSEILEVGIGMSLLFLFMSLIASALREGLEGWLKFRAKNLERGIAELIGEGNLKGFYTHPAISGLYRGTYEEARTGRGLPSYIPSRNFALAAMQLVAAGSADTAGLAPQESRKATASPEAQASSPSKAPDQPRMSLIDLQGLRTAIDAIQEPKTRAMLSHILDEAGEDVAKVRAGFEAWFDGSMDRVSGWYKRHTQAILFGLGLGAAVMFNVDAITVAQRLLVDKTLRNAVVKQAESLAPKPGGTEGPVALQDLQKQSFDQLRAAVESVGYPIGWVRDAASGLPFPAPQLCTAGPTQAGSVAFTCSMGWAALLIPFGWFVTALAVMLGAPFWFDVLNKFMVIRSTVKPTEKSKDEDSEDRQTKPAGG